MIVLHVPSLLSLSVLAELQQTDCMTSEECKRLYYLYRVVGVQSTKSTEVVSQTSEIMKKHGLEKESKLLPGKWMYSRSSVFGCALEWSQVVTTPF